MRQEAVNSYKVKGIYSMTSFPNRSRISNTTKTLCFLGFLNVFLEPSEAADIIISGGHIFTADENYSSAEAVAVQGNSIVFVGSEKQAMALRRPETQIIDAQGKMVLPGFHDAHIHPILGGRSLLGCDLSIAPDLQALTLILRSCVASSNNTWIIAEGLNLGFFPPSGPTLPWLDQISDTKPLLVRASDGHAISVNSIGLALAKIDKDTIDPPAGLIERDYSGNPSGTLRESAIELLETKLPKTNENQRITLLLAAIKEINSFGITSIFDAWVGSKDIAAYRTVEANGQLSLRVRAALAYGYGDLFVIDSIDTYESLLADRVKLKSERFNLAAVKLFIDGVLEGETAALLSPYLHKKGYRGKITYDQSQLNKIVADLIDSDLQVYTHAIGDGGVRAILDAIENAQSISGGKDLRHHVSHLQLIHPDDYKRFGELGIVANFQALWALPDEWIINLNLPVVGVDRVNRMYPIASIVRSGGTIVGGSDWNVSSLNPLDAIEVALLRQDWKANDKLDNVSLSQLDVLNHRERVNLETMLRAYTINAAWSMHQENLTGSLTPGKRADIIVLSDDLFEIPPQHISQVVVERTMIDGIQVYRHE